MATKHKRATMTARQLAEDYLAHQITRDVTRTSTPWPGSLKSCTP